jgi:autotransporter translocation and assembly factor TamB
MQSIRVVARLALISLLVTLVAVAQTPNPAGHWEGKVQSPDGEVAIMMDLDKNEKGEWIGDFDAPDRNVNNLPLAAIVLKGEALTFELSGFPAKLDGKLSEDGQTFSGNLTFRQEMTMPFSLKKTGPAKVTLPPKSSPLTADFEGRWEGTLEAGGRSLRLVVRLEKAADGTATGAMDSVDQGANDLRLAGIIIDGLSLRFSLPMAGGSYEGKLNKATGELAGQWSQGGATLPLTLKRQAQPAQQK